MRRQVCSLQSPPNCCSSQSLLFHLHHASVFHNDLRNGWGTDLSKPGRPGGHPPASRTLALLEGVPSGHPSHSPITLTPSATGSRGESGAQTLRVTPSPQRLQTQVSVVVSPLARVVVLVIVWSFLPLRVLFYPFCLCQCLLPGIMRWTAAVKRVRGGTDTPGVVVWVGMCLPKGCYIAVLILIISECDLIWKLCHCRCN